MAVVNVAVGMAGNKSRDRKDQGWSMRKSGGEESVQVQVQPVGEYGWIWGLKWSRGVELRLELKLELEQIRVQLRWSRPPIAPA